MQTLGTTAYGCGLRGRWAPCKCRNERMNDCCSEGSGDGVPEMALRTGQLLWGERHFLLSPRVLPAVLERNGDETVTGEKPNVLLPPRGGLIMKLRPKEMTKAGSFYTFYTRPKICEELTG